MNDKVKAELATMSKEQIVDEVCSILAVKCLQIASEVTRSVAQKCAEICENEEVLLPLEAWSGTKKAHGAAVAKGLGSLIRKEFNL